MNFSTTASDQSSDRMKAFELAVLVALVASSHSGAIAYSTGRVRVVTETLYYPILGAAAPPSVVSDDAIEYRPEGRNDPLWLLQKDHEWIPLRSETGNRGRSVEEDPKQEKNLLGCLMGQLSTFGHYILNAVIPLYGFPHFRVAYDPPYHPNNNAPPCYKSEVAEIEPVADTSVHFPTPAPHP